MGAACRACRDIVALPTAVRAAALSGAGRPPVALGHAAGSCQTGGAGDRWRTVVPTVHTISTFCCCARVACADLPMAAWQRQPAEAIQADLSHVTVPGLL